MEDSNVVNMASAAADTASSAQTSASESETGNNANVVTFKKPYIFEGTTYSSVDLTPLEDASVNDLCKAQKMFTNAGNVSSLPEFEYEFICDYLSTVLKLPIEFFKGLPAQEGVKIKSLVTNNFFSGDS